MKPKTILEDDREIESISWDDETGSAHNVGLFNCTRIIAYGEPGMHCDIPFLAVYFGEEIGSRVPATQVRISYADKAEADAARKLAEEKLAAERKVLQKEKERLFIARRQAERHDRPRVF